MTVRLLSVLCVLLLFISQATAQPDFVKYHCMNDKGNFTANSRYQTNLNTVLSNLTSNTQIDYGFYNSSHGQNSDKVNAIGMCRGDVEPDECRSCLNNSRVLLTQLCANQKEAISWYDTCMLRYSNRSIFGITETQPVYYIWNNRNATSVEQFNQVLMDLVDGLRSKAASGDSRRKFAANSTPGPSFQTIFAHVQCTPDLSELECNVCLVGAIADIQQFGNGKVRGRIFKPSCNLRFDLTPYYDLAAEASPPQASPPPPSTNITSTEGRRKIRSKILALMVLVPVAILVMLFCIGYYFHWRKARKTRKAILKENFGDESTCNLEALQFDLATIEVATNKFSFENKIGKGGFGEVYKGVLLNGQEIAVKRLSKSSTQGAIEFKNEVLLIAKLQHRNLVALLGFCLEGQEKILIYEYVPNKSLDYFLFDSLKYRLLSWNERYEIIRGIVQAIMYLHEHSRLKVIHRDLKPSNILLDNNMNPKISDFGMARMVAVDEDEGSTMKVVGTYGYMSPEYAMFGKFSEKSDVFSFGVMILEIISGKRNSNSYESNQVVGLLNYAWRKWKNQTPLDILDLHLKESHSKPQVIRCIEIGLLCVQENPDDRPTMAMVHSYLNNLSMKLPLAREPAFYIHGRTELDIIAVNLGHSTNNVIISVNEMSVSNFFPR